MGIMVRAFEGNLNLDYSPYRLPKGDYIDALNITRDSQSSGNDLVVSNIVGNRLVLYSGFYPGTTNICIGAYNDDIKNRVIYFVWNSGGYHSILLYDNASRTITKIFESKTDSNGIDILNLQLLYKVNNINVIHREEDGDLLLWNDAYNRPGQINVDDFKNGLYGTSITDDMIRLAKMPPVDDFLPVYESDATVIVNNLKRKLFQFAYAWGYSAGEVSTISPTTKTVLPTNAYSVETESNPTQNNVINLPLIASTGADYKFIRIFGRESNGTTWGDWFVIDTLDREDYAIPFGGTFNYKFLNDGQYITADPLYMELLFDYCADQCNAQGLVNGNVIVQGAITEGYDLIKRENINVNITSEYIVTSGSPVSDLFPTLTYSLSNTPTPPLLTKRITLTIGPDIANGFYYQVKIQFKGSGSVQYNVSANYTATGLDTLSTVRAALISALTTALASVPFTSVSASILSPDRILIGYIYNSAQVETIATAPIASLGGNATWKWAAKYRLGLVYVDKYGKSNGVISFVGTEDDPTDFSLTTGGFAYDDTPSSPTYGNPKIPIIKASINHIPPDWAVAYYWVRTSNQTTNSFLQYITSEVQTDGNYIYFCIENLNIFKEQTTGFVPSYTFKSGDRLNVLAAVHLDGTPTPYNVIDTPHYDFEILGTVQRDMEITTGTPTQGQFIKVAKPSGGFPWETFPNFFIELYTPLVRDSDTTQIFYEFGEAYPIYIDNVSGIHYHVGGAYEGNQDQTASQPATFTFVDGDVYYKFRQFYKLNEATGKIDPTDIFIRGVMDANYSDYWASAVNSNGTAWVIDPNAKRLFKPTLIRFGQAYQPGTDINGLNRFYPVNFDEYFRDYGAIMNFSIRDKMLHVYQKLKVGRVPVYGQIIKDTGGNEQLVVSDRLLNTIQYYIGNYGIGDHPESLASNNYADYFLSNIRGVYCRLSQNGLEPISISHNINNFAVTELGGRDFNYKCYGVFDAYNNLYITALEETPNLPAKTLQWNEQRNGFESFLSYKPEMMVCLNQLMITFKGGQIYTHDNYEQYNTFYGTTYDSYITPVFNDNIVEKKTWQNVTELASNVWDVPEIITNVKSGVFPNQLSDLKEGEFTYLEGDYFSSIKKTSNSGGGKVSGDALKGNYVTMKFRKAQPTTLEFLNLVTVGFIDSPVTNRQ